MARRSGLERRRRALRARLGRHPAEQPTAVMATPADLAPAASTPSVTDGGEPQALPARASADGTATAALARADGATPLTTDGATAPAVERVGVRVLPLSLDPAFVRRRPWRQRLRSFQSYLMPFGVTERDWSWLGLRRGRAIGLVIAACAVVLAVAVGAVALASATHVGQAAAGKLPTGFGSVAPPSGVIVQPVTGSASPTPALPTYLVGAWVSNSEPAGGVLQVYVRVTANDAPLAAVVVSLSSNAGGGTTYPPLATDAYGLATFTVTNNDPNTHPVVLTASVVIAGHTYSAQTSFNPQ